MDAVGIGRGGCSRSRAGDGAGAGAGISGGAGHDVGGEGCCGRPTSGSLSWRFPRRLRPLPWRRLPALWRVRSATGLLPTALLSSAAVLCLRPLSVLCADLPLPGGLDLLRPAADLRLPPPLCALVP